MTEGDINAIRVEMRAQELQAMRAKTSALRARMLALRREQLSEAVASAHQWLLGWLP